MKRLKPLVVKLTGVKRFKRLLEDGVSALNFRSGYVTLRPGVAIGEHSTASKEEVIILLSGKARVSFDGRKAFIAKESSLIYIPPQTKHNLENIGKKLLRYIYVTHQV